MFNVVLARVDSFQDIQGVSKVRSDFLFVWISLIIKKKKKRFVKLNMLFIIHLTLNN